VPHHVVSLAVSSIAIEYMNRKMRRSCFPQYNYCLTWERQISVAPPRATYWLHHQKLSRKRNLAINKRRYRGLTRGQTPLLPNPVFRFICSMAVDCDQVFGSRIREARRTFVYLVLTSHIIPENVRGFPLHHSVSLEAKKVLTMIGYPGFAKSWKRGGYQKWQPA